MWPRYTEIAFSFLLTLSSLYFRHFGFELVAFPLIALISLLNFRYRYIHIVNAIPALSLILLVFLLPVPFPVSQSYLVLGLLLLVLSLIPPNASKPPPEWEKFNS